MKRKNSLNYSLRKKIAKPNKEEEEEDNVIDIIDEESEYSYNSSDSDSDSDSETASIHSVDLSDEEDKNMDILNDESIERNLTKSIINKMMKEIEDESIKNNISLYKYLDNKESLVNDNSNNKNTDIVQSSANEITRKIIIKLINEIRHEAYLNKNLNVLTFLNNKLEVIDELNSFIDDKKEDSNKLVFQLSLNPLKYFNSLLNRTAAEEEEYYEEEEEYDDINDDNVNNDNKSKNNQNSLDSEFLRFLKEGMFTPKDDLAYFKKLTDDEKRKYLDNIKEIKQKHKIDKPRILQVIESSNTLNNKSIILKKLQRFESLSPFSSEYFKLKNWVDGITQIPFGVYKNTPVTLDSSKSKVKKYLCKIRKYMDDAVYGHENAKKQILQVVAHTISNPKEGGTIIAIQGPPGVGKTQLIQDGISKALQRPFEFISLGGATDSSFLEGHDYTYEGSKCGMIVDVLKKAKCMNPVIFFDELDKVSQTQKGEEIINILTHLTDSTQNHHFNDKYFSGIDFDLSKCIFIFSFNEEWKINRILKDRMYIIRTKGFQVNDKVKIATDYLIPKLLKSVGFQENDLSFSEEVIKFIIDQYTFEGGVRRLKECLLEITKEINLRSLDGTKLLDQEVKLPIGITKKMLTDDIFRKRVLRQQETIHKKPKIGLVNGLWANDMGVGGLVPIEAFTIPTNNKLELELTGMQGDVMKESMRVAKTVAWNILPDKIKAKLNENWKSFGNSGIHIHCPDGSTHKDGPSAGAAITTAIISLLMKQKVNNKIAMTGEINLKGQITQIGGLSEKLNGAKKAGIKTVLIPKGNEPDYNKILISPNNPIDKNFNVIIVNNIWEVLKLCFMKTVKVRKY